MMPQTNFYAFFDRPTQQNLDTNKSGRLTPDQQAALKKGVRQQWGRVVLWLFVLFVLCGAFGLFFYAMIGGIGPSLLGPVLTSAFVISIALLVLGAFLFPDLSLIMAGSDIAAGQVDSVSGKIEWTGRKYKVVSDSHTLRTVRGNISMPPPGAYRFYCLPNSGLVIQAEALGEASARQSQDLLLEALSRAIGFSPDDLSVNRQQGLSGGQTLRLIGFAILQGVVFLLCVGFGTWLGFNLPTGEDLIWALVFVVLMVILALSAVWNILKVGLDLISRGVTNVDGFVVRHEHRTRNGRYYTYQIKNLKFRVSRNAFNALVSGWEYRVYYSTRSKRLLAIEPLRQNQIVYSEDMTR